MLIKIIFFYVFVDFIRLNATHLSKFVFAFFFCRIAVTLGLLKKKKIDAIQSPRYRKEMAKILGRKPNF
jgi:hypothetical protein